MQILLLLLLRSIGLQLVFRGGYGGVYKSGFICGDI